MKNLGRCNGLEVGMVWAGSNNNKNDPQNQRLMNEGMSGREVAGKLRPDNVQP